MKRLFSLFVLCVPLLYLHAQSTVVHYQEKDVTIDHQIQDCNRPEDGIYKQYLVLRYINDNNHDVTISFNRVVWYNGKCTGCNNEPESLYTVTIPAKSVVQGDCQNKDKAYFIFNKMLDESSKTVLEKFELRNITVTKK